MIIKTRFIHAHFKRQGVGVKGEGLDGGRRGDERREEEGKGGGGGILHIF